MAAVLVIGCGGEPSRPDLSVGVGVGWPDRPETRDAVGFTIYGVVKQRPAEGADRCRELPASARITVDGAEIPLSSDANGCLDIEFATGPTLDWGNEPVTVLYEESGQPIGEAVFSGLAPGAEATLLAPADGLVHPGDELLIVPPAALPTSHAGYVNFYPLDAPAETVWNRSGVPGTTAPVRMADGLHVKVPPIVGRAVVVMPGTPSAIFPDYTCEGFAICTGTGANVLGPVYVTGVQP